jgi:hypothetical protein
MSLQKGHRTEDTEEMKDTEVFEGRFECTVFFCSPPRAGRPIALRAPT